MDCVDYSVLMQRGNDLFCWIVLICFPTYNYPESNVIVFSVAVFFSVSAFIC